MQMVIKNSFNTYIVILRNIDLLNIYILNIIITDNSISLEQKVVKSRDCMRYKALIWEYYILQFQATQ